MVNISMTFAVFDLSPLTVYKLQFFTLINYSIAMINNRLKWAW